MTEAILKEMSIEIMHYWARLSGTRKDIGREMIILSVIVRFLRQ